jgi:hypothetical protein
MCFKRCKIIDEELFNEQLLYFSFGPSGLLSPNPFDKIRVVPGTKRFVTLSLQPSII